LSRGCELSALILDYGKVLSWPQRADCVAAMAGRLGVAVEAFRDAYWRHAGSTTLGSPPPKVPGRVLERWGGAPAADRAAIIDWLSRLTSPVDGVPGGDGPGPRVPADGAAPHSSRTGPG
jgi:hypothetical protein